MDEVTIIRIDTGQAVQSVGDLQQNIKLLKERLKEAQIGTEEYQQTVKALKENQAALKDAMYGTAGSMEQLTADAKGLNVTLDKQGKLVNAETVSYNALVHTLADLKTQWRQATDEATRADLGAKINAVNNRLKDMDASVGVFKRNVGNYTGSIVDAFGKMGGGAAAMVGPIRTATTAMDVMGKTPVLAIMGLLAGVLNSVIKNLKTSEENTQALTAAMAPLQSIGDAVTKVMQGLGKGVAWVVEQFGKLTEKVFGTNKAMQDRADLAAKENALAKQQRETLVENAKAERDIAELRAKASDKATYSASERLAFLQQAGDKEKEIADRSRQQAKQEYEALKLRTSLTQSSKEDLDALAAAEEKWIRADTNYYNAVRTINAGIVKAKREEEKARREAAKAADDEAKRVREAALAKIAAEKQYIDSLIQFTKKGSEERLDLQNQAAQKEKERAEAEAKTKITDAEELTRALEIIDKNYNLALEKNQREHDEAVRKETLQAIANRRDLLERGSVEQLAAQVEYQQAALASLTQGLDETDAEFEARRIAAQQAVTDAQKALQDQSLAIERTAWENRMNTYQEGSLAYLKAAVELKQYELDTLHQLEGESDEEFRARQLAAEKAHSNAMKAVWDARVKMFSESVGATSGLLSSLADLYESDGKNSAKNAQKIKALRIAQATIDMLSGVVAAVANAYKSADPATASVLAAVNSAAIIAAGVANINKIKATQIPGASSAGSGTATPATVNAPTPTAEVQQVRTLTGASEEERLNRMASDQRVYIVYSDIEAAQHGTRTRVRESTF